jgi:pimeloyl-ACP methyl ester carboxylesterase
MRIGAYELPGSCRAGLEFRCYVTTGELFFRKYDQGGGRNQPPLLLIHGAGGNLAHWPPQVRRLPDATVYAIDLPGHGQSPGTGAASIEGYADAVLDFLNAEALTQVIVTGHSMGGAIAQDLARRVPGRIAGLALIATGARLPVAPALLDGLRTDYAGSVSQLAKWVYGPTVGDRQRDDFRRQLMRLPSDLLLGDFMACAAFDASVDLAAMAMPALVLCGQADRMTPTPLSRQLQEALPAAELQLLDETGHMVMLERPDVTAELLRAFIQTLTARPGDSSVL